MLHYCGYDGGVGAEVKGGFTKEVFFVVVSFLLTFHDVWEIRSIPNKGNSEAQRLEVGKGKWEIGRTQ